MARIEVEVDIHDFEIEDIVKECQGAGYIVADDKLSRDLIELRAAIIAKDWTDALALFDRSFTDTGKLR